MANIYKNAIVYAFLELSKEKKIQDITVSDITKKCSISRQTFYRYFHDKYSIVEYVYMNSTTVNADSLVNKEISFKEAISNTYKFMYENKNFYSFAITYSGQNSLEEIIYSDICSFLRKIIEERHGKEALTSEVLLAIDFLSSGSTHLIKNWIRSGMNESWEMMGALTTDCMPQIIKNLL